MGKKLDAARAENENLLAEIRFLNRALTRIQQEPQTFYALAARSATADEVVYGTVYDVSIGPFNARAVVEEVRYKWRDGKAVAISARIRLSQRGPDQP